MSTRKPVAGSFTDAEYEEVVVTRQEIIARIQVVPEDGGADHAVAVAFRAIGDHFAETAAPQGREPEVLQFTFRDVTFSATAERDRG